MATRLYYRDAPASIGFGKGVSQFRDEWPPQAGSLRPYLCKALSTARGAAATTGVINTITVGGTGIAVLLTKTAGATPGIIFISEPVDQDVTISGSILHNLRAAESNMSANAAINVGIYRLAMATLHDLQSDALIDFTARTTEVAVTTEAANNFSETPASGIALAKGDRILLHLGFGPAGTMASGFTATFWYDGPTAAASGDSYIEFTETFGFLETAPAGSQLFLTDAASDLEVHGSRYEREMWTARGGGVVSKVTNVRTPQDFNASGTFYIRDINSGLTDCLSTGVHPPVVRDGDAVIEQTAETATTHTPALDTATNDIGAQSIVPGADAWCYGWGVRLIKNGSGTPGYTFSVNNDDGADRPGTLRVDNTSISFSLLAGSGTYSYVAAGEQDDWDAVFPVVEEGTLLTSGVKYWLKILCTITSATASIQTAGADGSNDNYAAGSRVYSTNGGGAWTQPANEDWAFRALLGRIVEWYTPELAAFTLGGLARLNLRALASDADTGTSLFAALWVVDADGSNPVLWGIGQFNSATASGELTTSEVAYQFDIAGDDLAVTEGQRLRLRVYGFGTSEQAQVAGDSFTLFYAGTSGGASGDSWIQFTQTLEEPAVPGTAITPVLPHRIRDRYGLAHR